MSKNAYRKRPVPTVLAALVVALGPSLVAEAQAANVGRVSVMEVDEVRDAASVSRAKALYRSRTDGAQDSGAGTSSSGCSDLSIGNVDVTVGQRAPRNVTVVIEGPVIQENNCR